MNTFARELRDHVKSLIGWSLVVAFFIGAGTIKFTGVEAGGTEMVQQLLASFPRMVLAVLGMTEVDLASFSGFYGMLEFFVAVIVAVFAVHLGRDAVSRELVDGTYEFLFVRPRSRSTILAQKLAAACVCLLIVCLVNFGVSLVSYQALGLSEDMTAPLLSFTLWLGIIGLIFMAIGAACAAACRRPETGAKAGNAAVLAAYVLGVIYDMFGNEAMIARMLSPFAYFPASEVVTGTFDPAFVALAVGIVVVGLAVAFVCFERRDLTAAD